MSLNILTRPQMIISEAVLTDMEGELKRRQETLERMRLAMETLAGMNESSRFKGAAMALCNEIAARWQAERVSLGFLRGRYVRVVAMSHTEKFTRKMQLVQNIEAAMEECLDQDVEVIYPASPEATYVSRAAKTLGSGNNPLAICSLPVRRQGDVLAVLTVERVLEKPFQAEEVEAFRLIVDLCSARLVELQETDRWVGARALAAGKRFCAGIVGPKYTWAKIITVLVAAAIVTLCFWRGTYSVEGTFVLQPTEKQEVVAPFDGYLRKVFVHVGQRVRADTHDPLLHSAAYIRTHRPDGTILATLNTASLRDKLASAEAQRRGYLKEAEIAQKKGKIARQQIALEKGREVAAQISLLHRQIAVATITSPMAGVVLSGDLRKRIGARVKIGQVLFAIAPVHALRAELSISQDQIGDVKVGQTGTLATASYPSRKVAFTVVRIDPAARITHRRNMFRVRVRLLHIARWMRPGMEGVAHIHIATRLKAWIWTHRLINWVRMKLWL